MKNNFNNNVNNNRFNNNSEGDDLTNNRNNFRDSQKEDSEPYRVNHRVRAPQVRLVGENVKPDIYDREDAMRIAQEQGLDLVEISPNATPPVCKVMDYSKFKYEQKKRQKELKAKTHKTVVKEIRFGPNTDDHDLEFKTKHAHNFLKEGNKVRAFVQFFGRSISYTEQGEEILNRFISALDAVGKLEQGITKEGRKMSILLAPKSTTDVKVDYKKTE